MTMRPLLSTTPFWAALVILLAALIGSAHGPRPGAAGGETTATVQMLAVDVPMPDAGMGSAFGKTVCAVVLCSAAIPASASAAIAESPDIAWPPAGGAAWAGRPSAPDDRPPIRLV